MMRITQVSLRDRLEAPLLALGPLLAPAVADDEAAAPNGTSGQVPEDTLRPLATGPSGQPGGAAPAATVDRGSADIVRDAPRAANPGRAPQQAPAPQQAAAPAPAAPAAPPTFVSQASDGPLVAAPGYLLDRSWSAAPASPQPVHAAPARPASPPAVSQHSSSASGAPASSSVPSASSHDGPARAPIAGAVAERPDARLVEPGTALREYGQYRHAVVDRLLQLTVAGLPSRADSEPDSVAGSNRPTSDYDVTLTGPTDAGAERFNDKFAAKMAAQPTGPALAPESTSGHVSSDVSSAPAGDRQVSAEPPPPSTRDTASVAPLRPVPLVRARPTAQPAATDDPVREAPPIPPQRVAPVAAPPESRSVRVEPSDEVPAPPAPGVAAPVPVRVRSRDPQPVRRTLQFAPDLTPDHVPSDMPPAAPPLARADASPRLDAPAALPAPPPQVTLATPDRPVDLPPPPAALPVASPRPAQAVPAAPPAPRPVALAEHATVAPPEVRRPDPPVPVAAPAPALDPVQLEDVLADILRAAARRQGVEV